MRLSRRRCSDDLFLFSRHFVGAVVQLDLLFLWAEHLFLSSRTALVFAGVKNARLLRTILCL